MLLIQGARPSNAPAAPGCRLRLLRCPHSHFRNVAQTLRFGHVRLCRLVSAFFARARNGALLGLAPRKAS